MTHNITDQLMAYILMLTERYIIMTNIIMTYWLRLVSSSKMIMTNIQTLQTHLIAIPHTGGSGGDDAITMLTMIDKD